MTTTNQSTFEGALTVVCISLCTSAFDTVVAGYSTLKGSNLQLVATAVQYLFTKKNQCLTCCLTCCFWCWISHWVLLILSWNMWLRGRSGGLWLGRDPGGVGGSVKIGDWVFDLVGVFPWLRSFGLTFRLLVLREYSYLGVFLSAVTIWSMPFVLVSCC